MVEGKSHGKTKHACDFAMTKLFELPCARDISNLRGWLGSLRVAAQSLTRRKYGTVEAS